jgi:hypothetical protein
METETARPAVTFHNRCGISRNDCGDHGICAVHSVPVYLDGQDWLTDKSR